MMRYRVHFFLSFICIVYFLFISISHANTKDDVTKGVLSQVQKQYQSATYLSAKFSQKKQVSFISKPLISYGEFQFANEFGLNWQIETPFFSRTLFVQQGVFKLSQKGEVTKEEDKATRAIASFLQSVFSGQWQSLNQQFDIGEIQYINDKDWEVTLIAKALWIKKTIHSIRLQGNTNSAAPEGNTPNSIITKIELVDTANNTTEIHFLEVVKQNTPLDEEQRKTFLLPNSFQLKR